jgi:putative SOS response-associated peptidase YedK
MCGRFTSEIPPELLTDLFGLAEPPTIAPRYNIAPTQQIPVIREVMMDRTTSTTSGGD